MFSISLTIILQYNSVNESEILKTPLNTKATVISITSNAGFDAYDSGGTGSSSSPWIIQGYTITGSDSSIAIYISGITAYFILRNCVIKNRASQPAIYLYNVDNANISWNIIQYNYDGIYAYDLDYSYIQNNDISSNYDDGIEMRNCDGCDLLNNVVTGNNDNGLYMYYCDNNDLYYNTFSSNFEGIYMYTSNNYNVISQNTINSNDIYGISISSSSTTGNTISYNTLYYNQQGGINNPYGGNSVYGNDVRDYDPWNPYNLDEDMLIVIGVVVLFIVIFSICIGISVISNYNQKKKKEKSKTKSSTYKKTTPVVNKRYESLDSLLSSRRPVPSQIQRQPTIRAVPQPQPQLRSWAGNEEFVILKGAKIPVINGKLDLSSKDIKSILDITGLNKLTSLEYLDLHDNNISSIQGLDNLRSLKHLNLHANFIESITGLENLINLEYLFLGDNLITEISGLENLTNLEILTLAKNEITEIKGLDGLAHLKNVNLQNNKITEVKGLESLHSLQNIWLNDNPIIQSEQLLVRNYSRNARKIVEYCKLKQVKPQPAAQPLDTQFVIVKGTKYQPINGKLSLNSQSLESITEVVGLSRLTTLQELDLHSNQIAKIEGLENLINLKRLNLHDNLITSISGLDSLKNLELLFLGDNLITEIKGLNNLARLEMLSMAKNEIKQIKGLDGLRNLKNLNLQFNKITEIRGLENLRKLEKIWLENNPLIDADQKQLQPYYDAQDLVEYCREKAPSIPIRIEREEPVFQVEAEEPARESLEEASTFSSPDDIREYFKDYIDEEEVVEEPASMINEPSSLPERTYYEPASMVNEPSSLPERTYYEPASMVNEPSSLPERTYYEPTDFSQEELETASERFFKSLETQEEAAQSVTDKYFSSSSVTDEFLASSHSDEDKSLDEISGILGDTNLGVEFVSFDHEVPEIYTSSAFEDNASEGLSAILESPSSLKESLQIEKLDLENVIPEITHISAFDDAAQDELNDLLKSSKDEDISAISSLSPFNEHVSQDFDSILGDSSFTSFSSFSSEPLETTMQESSSFNYDELIKAEKDESSGSNSKKATPSKTSSMINVKKQDVYVEFNGELIEVKDNKLFLQGRGVKDIRDIKGIEKLFDLEELDLSHNEIKYIRGLDNLKNLKRLDLNSNEIKILSGLDHQRNLETLTLEDNKIRSIRGLFYLTNLKYLDLRSNDIRKISGLSELRKLEYLNLFNNKITRIEGMENLRNLESFICYENPIKHDQEEILLQSAQEVVEYCQKKAFS